MPAWLSQLWFDDQARHHVDNRDRARGGHGEIARRQRQQRGVSSLGDRQSTFATESRAKLLGKLLWHGWWQTSAVVACRLQLITMVHNWSRGVFGITPFLVFLLFTLIPSRCLPP